MAFALLGFLSGLPPRQMDRLYASPWACLAVLRALPPLGKHYAMRLLYIEAGVPMSDVDAWIKPEGEEQEATNARYQDMHTALMTTLTDMGMEKIPTVGAEFDYNLHMAIQQIPSDEYDENVVCSEMQPGYTIKGQLVRAAYVMVSSGM